MGELLTRGRKEWLLNPLPFKDDSQDLLALTRIIFDEPVTFDNNAHLILETKLEKGRVWVTAAWRAIEVMDSGS